MKFDLDFIFIISLGDLFFSNGILPIIDKFVNALKSLMFSIRLNNLFLIKEIKNATIKPTNVKIKQLNWIDHQLSLIL